MMNVGMYCDLAFAAIHKHRSLPLLMALLKAPLIPEALFFTPKSWSESGGIQQLAGREQCLNVIRVTFIASGAESSCKRERIHSSGLRGWITGLQASSAVITNATMD